MAKGTFGLIEIGFQAWLSGDIGKIAAARDAMEANPVIKEGIDTLIRLIDKFRGAGSGTAEDLHNTLVAAGTHPDTAAMVIRDIQANSASGNPDADTPGSSHNANI